MRIVIAGGSGLLGRPLAARLEGDGHAVSVLTRHARRVGDVEWNPDAPDAPWAGVVGTADAVINLAGESIAGGRWTSARKAALRDSRLRATRALAAAIHAASHKPPAFLSGSAIGIYGPRGDEPVTEETAPGADFLSTLAIEWEREAMAAAPVTRVVLLRTGVVLAREGGALPQMALPFRFFAGGPHRLGPPAGVVDSRRRLGEHGALGARRAARQRSAEHHGTRAGEQRRPRAGDRPCARPPRRHAGARLRRAAGAGRDGRRRVERAAGASRQSGVQRLHLPLSRIEQALREIYR